MNKIITEADLEITTTNLVVYKTQYSKQLYVDKKLAIWNSITHVKCTDCNNITPKFYTYCEICRSKNRLEQYNLLPVLTTWNYPIYCDTLDKFFDNEDELLDYIEDEDITDYLWYSCEPNTLPALNYDDLDTEEDYELPEQLQTLLEQLNKIAIKTVVNYSPNYKYRILMDIQH